MKVIDKKGRLFGSINIIDFIAILLLASLLPLLYLGYRMTAWDTDNIASVTVRAEFSRLIPEVVEQIKVGEVTVPFTNKKGARVKEIIEIKEAKQMVLLGSPSNISSRSHDTYGLILGEQLDGKQNVILDAEIFCNEESGILYHESQPVKIGEPLKLSMKFYTLRGVIKAIDHK